MKKKKKNNTNKKEVLLRPTMEYIEDLKIEEFPFVKKVLYTTKVFNLYVYKENGKYFKEKINDPLNKKTDFLKKKPIHSRKMLKSYIHRVDDMRGDSELLRIILLLSNPQKGIELHGYVIWRMLEIYESLIFLIFPLKEFIIRRRILSDLNHLNISIRMIINIVGEISPTIFFYFIF